MDLLHLLPFKQVSLVTVYSRLLYCTFQPMICMEYFCCTDWAWQSILNVWKFLKEKKVRPSKVYLHILVFVWFYLSLTKIIFLEGEGEGGCGGNQNVRVQNESLHSLKTGFSCMFCCMHAFTTLSRGENFSIHFLFLMCPLVIVGGISCLQKVAFAWSWFWESEGHLGSDTWSAKGYIIVLCSVLIL